jgi:hypothetical protein
MYAWVSTTRPMNDHRILFFPRLKRAEHEADLALPSGVGVKNIYRCTCPLLPFWLCAALLGTWATSSSSIYRLYPRTILICTPSVDAPPCTASDSAVLPAVGKLAVVQLLSGGCLKSCSLPVTLRWRLPLEAQSLSDVTGLRTDRLLAPRGIWKSYEKTKVLRHRARNTDLWIVLREIVVVCCGTILT